VLPAAGIPALSLGGYEADDIMATLAVSAARRGDEALIVSTDRDLLQLVRPGIGIVVPGKTNLLVTDADGVRERMGVGPEGITTFKALAGDASDNIPGVAGIGAKTAAGLVNDYRTLEEIYSRLTELPPRVSARLSEGRDQAFLFREVVTVVTDLDLPVSLDGLPALTLTPETRVREIIDAGTSA
jgi:DNA polymerase-1